MSGISAQGSTLQISTGTGGAKTITAITVGNPTIITSAAHGLSNGDVVTFASLTGADAALLNGMSRSGAVRIDSREVEGTATSMVVVLTYWLSFEYVRDPRKALEPEYAQRTLLRGAQHVLNLLVPYLEPGQRSHLLQLVGAYNQDKP